jgi:proteasome lid subunit RPN8/RPN11
MKKYRYYCRQGIHDEIMNAIGKKPAETGGVLGGNRKTGCISHFLFDDSAACSGATYSPDVERLNKKTFPAWNDKDIYLIGFVHSHPGRLSKPSGGDIVYAQRILAGIPEMDVLLMPIIIPADFGQRAEIYWWVIDRQGHIHAADVTVSDHAMPDQERIVQSGDNVRALTGMKAHHAYQAAGACAVPTVSAPMEPRFRRVENAYDLRIMGQSRVIVVGVGGARAWVEELARAGVKDFILIDPDVYEPYNIGTQQAYADEVGMPKVEAVAKALQRIDPLIRVKEIQKPLDKNLNDTAFERFLDGSLANTGRPPHLDRILLAGCTDDFYAQARINRLGLHFGVATLCAQVYQEGRGAEVTFTAPGYTPACNRCALSGRYEAFKEEGPKAVVGSHGTPIFATTRLNALKGFIALALLHRGTSHPRWGRLLEQIGKRNLIQIRLDPDIERTLGLAAFSKAFKGADAERLLFDDVVWLPQDADHPERNGMPLCPDCQGVGDLKSAIGQFADTIPMEGGRRGSENSWTYP